MPWFVLDFKIFNHHNTASFTGERLDDNFAKALQTQRRGIEKTKRPKKLAEICEIETKAMEMRLPRSTKIDPNQPYA